MLKRILTYKFVETALDRFFNSVEKNIQAKNQKSKQGVTEGEFYKKIVGLDFVGYNCYIISIYSEEYIDENGIKKSQTLALIEIEQYIETLTNLDLGTELIEEDINTLVFYL